MRTVQHWVVLLASPSAWMGTTLLFAVWLVGPWSPLPKGIRSEQVLFVQPTATPPDWITQGLEDSQSDEVVRSKLRTRIDVSANEASTLQLLRSISQQIGLDISTGKYENNLVRVYNPQCRHTIEWSSIPAHEALRRILAKIEYDWQISGNAVEVLPMDEVCTKFRRYDLAWLIPGDAQASSIADLLLDLTDFEVDLYLIGSSLLVEASESQHARLEQTLVQLSGMRAENLRKLERPEEIQ